jgi:hypothetical protein
MGIVYPEGADFVAILREWVHLTARSRFLALLGMTNKFGKVGCLMAGILAK